MLPIAATSTKRRLAATAKQLPYSVVSRMAYHLIAVLPVVQRAGSGRVALMISLLINSRRITAACAAAANAPQTQDDTNPGRTGRSARRQS
jgi:hypothetical protein